MVQKSKRKVPGAIPFKVVHDVCQVLQLCPAGTLEDRLQRYRDHLIQHGRGAAEIESRLAKARPVVEVVLNKLRTTDTG